jgi:hypothetical protein
MYFKVIWTMCSAVWFNKTNKVISYPFCNSFHLGTKLKTIARHNLVNEQLPLLVAPASHSFQERQLNSVWRSVCLYNSTLLLMTGRARTHIRWHTLELDLSQSRVICVKNVVLIFCNFQPLLKWQLQSMSNCFFVCLSPWIRSLPNKCVVALVVSQMYIYLLGELTH